MSGPVPVRQIVAAMSGERFPIDHVPSVHDLPTYAPCSVMSVVATRLRTALATLPTTPQGIAEFLGRHGIKGDPCASGTCPLSRYLTLRTGCPIMVGPHEVSASAPGWQFTHAAPPAIGSFVAGFDAGEWEYLLTTVGDDA